MGNQGVGSEHSILESEGARASSSLHQLTKAYVGVTAVPKKVTDMNYRRAVLRQIRQSKASMLDSKALSAQKNSFMQKPGGNAGTTRRDITMELIK